MKSKKFWIGLIFGVVFFAIVYLIFSPETTILKNIHNLPMGIWIIEEREVVINSNSPKINEVFQFMVISTHKLERISERDALAESCSGGECLYFRLTDIEPLGS